MKDRSSHSFLFSLRFVFKCFEKVGIILNTVRAADYYKGERGNLLVTMFNTLRLTEASVSRKSRNFNHGCLQICCSGVVNVPQFLKELELKILSSSSRRDRENASP